MQSKLYENMGRGHKVNYITTYIIKSFRDRFKNIRLKYDEKLKEAGADVVEWAHVSQAGNMSCVLQSQVSRLFLYQRPFIKAE